jgi:hypothetical protein
VRTWGRIATNRRSRDKFGSYSDQSDDVSVKLREVLANHGIDNVHDSAILEAGELGVTVQNFSRRGPTIFRAEAKRGSGRGAQEGC